MKIKLCKLNNKLIKKCLGVTKKGTPCKHTFLKGYDGYCFNHKNQIKLLNDENSYLIKKGYFKPFLKWVGGKQDSLEEIVSKIPDKINTYHEFFLGGGSVLLHVLYLKFSNQIKIKNINVSDLNLDLINVYWIIKYNWKVLYEFLKIYNNKYILKKNLEEKKEFYLNVRNIFNNNKKNIDANNKIEHAAVFIFLNKTCFRGMYRVNKKGDFNVPFGNYMKPKILIDKNKLEFVSGLFKDVNFYSIDYKEGFKKVKPRDFIYLDPPYFPENKNSFVAYNSTYFSLEEHIKLFNLIKLISLKSSCLLSNSNTQFVLDFFKDFFIKKNLVKTKMNSKNPAKQKIELLIFNSIKI